MIQEFIFNEPIPSCEISFLKYKDGKWLYGYNVQTPIILEDGKDYDLVIYEFISDLYLKNRSDINIHGVNIPIHSLKEYVDFLYLQRKTDLDYRKRWKEQNPDAKPSTIEIANKDYPKEELADTIHFISGILDQNEQTTKFIAI